MKASEAKKLTLEKLTSSPAIDSIYAKLMEKIKEAIQKRRFELVHPYTDLLPRGQWLSIDEQKAIENRLRQDGYEVTNYPDPDPGSPGSGPYTEVSWR